MTTGIRPRRTLIRLICKVTNPNVLHVIKRHTAERFAIFTVISFSLAFLHKDIRQQINTRRKHTIAAYNQATNIATPNFVVGVFYLQAYKALTKIDHIWTVLQKVNALKSHVVCVIQVLFTHKNKTVYLTKIRKNDGLTNRKWCQKRFWTSPIKLQLSTKS